jgi:deazaflavin-dependent oxidoreductase (nitroreductase family)
VTRRIPRSVARVPVWLFRHRLGWLFGGRIMMLEHIGRRTGQPRHVVLEVLHRQPGAVLLVSGYGRRSQWLANIRAQPAVRIWAGRVRARAGTAIILPPDVSRQRLETYRQHHRRAAAILGRILDIPDLTGPEALPADVGERLPLVEVRYDQH